MVNWYGPVNLPMMEILTFCNKSKVNNKVSFNTYVFCNDIVDTTKLVPANMANSLRTTVPMSIVKQLNLKQGDSLEWSMDKVNNRWIVSVRKK